jgi:hypothetical protein
MKRSSVSPQPKGKSKSLTKTASPALVEYLNQQYPKKIPIAALTAATKYFGRGRPLKKDDRVIRRLAGSDADLPTATLVDLLGSQETHERGKVLSDEAIKRVYQSFANAEGKLSFEYIMKLGESNGVTITDKVAKLIVKKYGKRKDHLTIDDCIKVNQRRNSKSVSKSPAKDKK